jgi:hypothetical protein
MKPASLLEEPYGTSPILVLEGPLFSELIKEFLAYRTSLGFNL